VTTKDLYRITHTLQCQARGYASKPFEVWRIVQCRY